AAVADSSGLTKADAGRAVDAVFSSIEGALKGGVEVRIVGFGTFSVAHRAATTGRNPRTGEAIQIAASKQPKFKAGAPLKDAVNS
ncbi:MAG: HU family DNA-binding protein, partial [Pseudomonadota bacterium]|nr:HU family DNA-binding protein [Pseudomonadota bacterium]